MREWCKYTLIYISVHNVFLIGLLVANETEWWMAYCGNKSIMGEPELTK